MSIDPRSAHALRMALVGRPLNGELESVSAEFRPLAERLASLPPEERPGAFEEAVKDRPDKDSITLALASADPDGPMPEPPFEGSENEDWPPLRTGGMPPALEFPVEVLPLPVANLVRETADAIGCPPDFPALAALAVSAGAIGRSVSLRIKDGYFAGPAVFAALVGPPSDGKTPALKIVASAVRKIDETLEAEHAQALDRWEEEKEAAGADKKSKAKPPPPPHPRRIDVDDITMEALPVILADNPRGLVMVRDELTSLFMGLNQFKGGKGNDRANLLKIWSGDAIKKDRVAHEANMPVRCPHPCMSIIGGLTPDMLGEMADGKGRADGSIDRFLFAYPGPLPVSGWSDRGVSGPTADEWHETVARLWSRTMNLKDGREVPRAIFFTDEAQEKWEALYNVHAAEMNAPEFPPQFRSTWGKFREYAGRLALNLACLHHAADPTADPADVPRVGPQRVEDAWRLVAYFKGSARRVRASISHGDGFGGNPAVKAVVQWLRDGQRTSFSERDIRQARRWINEADLSDALATLVTQNAIRRQKAPSGHHKGGRPPSAGFDVNPALLITQNPQNPRNSGPDTPFEPFEGFE